MGRNEKDKKNEREAPVVPRAGRFRMREVFDDSGPLGQAFRDQLKESLEESNKTNSNNNTSGTKTSE